MKSLTFHNVYFLLNGELPFLPIEEPRKKAFASSIDRSEMLTASYQARKAIVRIAVARLRAVRQAM